MSRRFPERKEPDCPAIILFRYSDRETIRIFEDDEDDYIAYFCKELLASELSSPFAEHIFSRLQRSSALKSVPGAPLRSTPGFNPVAPSALRSAAV